MKRNVIRHAVTQPPDQSIKLIPLTRGFTAIVDAIDYPQLSQLKWIAGMRTDGKAYAYSSKQRGPSMHRLIMGIPLKPFWVDHINGDTLDNRRANLRLVTGQQSNRNRTLRRDSRSGYKGVGTHPSGRFKVAITINNKSIHLGYVRDPAEGAKLYDEAAKKHFGTHAKLNFPEG